MRITLVVATLALMLCQSCSLLSDPRPESDFQNTRYAETGDGKSSPADELRIPSRWSQVTGILDEEFDTSTGAELLKSRHVFITTQADAAVLAVATTRATQTRIFAGDMGKTAVSLGLLYASMGGSAGLQAVIPAVQSVMASLSKPDQDSTSAAIQSLVDNPDLTTAEKEKKIRAYLALHGDH